MSFLGMWLNYALEAESHPYIIKKHVGLHSSQAAVFIPDL